MVVDSKQLSEAQRSAIFKKINETHYNEIGYFVTSLSAEYLSNTMLADNDKGGKNLNKISHDTAIDLIKKVMALGFKVKRIILDTVGDPKKYRMIVENAICCPDARVIVESKADDTYPVVSAASICAKVTRDSDLENFNFREKPKVEFGREFGCGYPSDPATKKWLKVHMDPVFGFPSIVRFSWKTSYAMLADNGHKIDWHDVAKLDAYNKTEAKKQETMRLEKEQIERNRLTQTQKERKMNVATCNLGLQRGFDF